MIDDNFKYELEAIEKASERARSFRKACEEIYWEEQDEDEDYD